MIVTVSNEYGSGALAIAARVAESLGYEYVDRQLPVVVAKRLRVTPEAVEASEDSQRSLGERLIDSLERATPELAQASAAQPLDEEVVHAVAQAVLEAAAGGNCVIVGRGAFAILAQREDLLRVFMHAPREWRIAHIVATSNVSREVAEAELDRVDRARVTYIRQWYGLTFGDMRGYDLCIDTSRLDAAQGCAAIVAAVRART
ncbi:MAG TPA: cytidylate kinase-like family protein [Candidatus Cybelea sp.]|nr:cytidylate kinase-like family protein [Candidatus Cybelea sp.]